MRPPLDLLHSEPRARLRTEPFGHLLAFAFATGAGTEEWERAQAPRDLDPSGFEAACFSQGLGLSALADRLSFTTDGRLRRPHRKVILQLLETPPRDRASVVLRHGILRELLARPDAHRAVERVWQAVDALEQVLLSKQIGQRLSFIHRRVEILRRLVEAVDTLSSPFDKAKSELCRMAIWGHTVQSSIAYGNLQKVLDHEDHLASVDIKVRLGYDGQIRNLSIVRVSENSENQHYRSPWQRLFSRLRFWFRGYVLRESEILGRLVESLFESIQPLVAQLINLRLDLEWYLCALDFHARASKAGLSLCIPEWTSSSEEATRLEGLFNPFLLNAGHAPVPCDLRCPSQQIVLVTGPNSGGKTRLLQAVGLAQLLAQTGFFVPAAKANLTWRTGLFVSAYEESTVDQDEGRLGTELVRIRHIFERIGRDQLVIVDELCSGTNPAEAEALIRFVLELLDRFGPLALITTHFLEFARGLSEQPPVQRMSFIQAQLDHRQKPTFQFGPGVASTSLAAQTAARLGVTREDLEALIAQRLS
jgi:DNA mismatch repair protein MutS2